MRLGKNYRDFLPGTSIWFSSGTEDGEMEDGEILEIPKDLDRSEMEG
jgi:hypothetical protein